MTSNKPIILVDLSNACYRSHFAHQHLMHEGRHTGTYHGLLQAILSLKKVSPRMVFCWDYGIPTDVPLTERPRCWRHATFPEYKAARTATPDHVIVRKQMPNVHRLLTWLGYSSVGIPGLEADDVISCIAHEIVARCEQVLIFSSDHDLYQILPNPNDATSENVQILQPGKKAGKYQRVTTRDVVKQFGITISRWPDYLALGGDSSDNIKPARGMGPKTALQLIAEGARPDRPFKEQYITFRQDHNKLEPVWPRIQAAYQVAKLPRTWRDPSINVYLNGSLPGYQTRQRWFNETERLQSLGKFMEFCAQHGLLQMLANRREFFQKESE